MDTVTAIHTRRSIRDYEERAVEREIIADILWDAAQAPTTPVSGPFLFHVIEGVARIADFGEHAKQYAREHRPDGTELVGALAASPAGLPPAVTKRSGGMEAVTAKGSW